MFSFRIFRARPVIDPSVETMDVNPVTLRFADRCRHLEKPFLEDFTNNNLPQIRRALIFSIILYAAFGVLDTIIAGELQARFWFVRFAIVCPTITIIFLLTFTKLIPRYLDPLISIGLLVAGFGVVYMTIVGNANIIRTYYAGLMLVIMIAYAFIRMRFIWAAPCCWAVIIAYVFAAASNPRLDGVLLANNVFFCVTANVVGMLACYSLEFYARHDFFMRQLLDEEHKKVTTARDELEKRVEERTIMLAETNEELRREIQAHQRLDWEKEALENQLRHAQKMEAIGTLAGGIAHDFNNILAAIMGHSELALMQLDEPDQAKLSLSEVLNASQRAKELVAQILAFSRHSESLLKPLQVSSIIKEAMRLLKATLPATIVIQEDIRAPKAIVVADATQIHQILMNLCTNSAHAMSPKGGTLTVSITEQNITPEQMMDNDLNLPATMKPGKYVRLTVADTGHGIPHHLLDRIFDPYFTTKDKEVGTGLGLAVVRGIVQNHGGEIIIDSTPGAGTSVNIYLPRVEGRAAPEIKHLQSLRRGNERILLVDDEAGLAALGGRLLTSLGYRVTAHQTPQEALKNFEAAPEAFDLVVTDMMMPKMDGETLARRIHAIRPGIPVILYTGFNNAGTAERLRHLGIKAILRKPITIYGLSEAVRKVLETE